MLDSTQFSSPRKVGEPCFAPNSVGELAKGLILQVILADQLVHPKRHGPIQFNLKHAIAVLEYLARIAQRLKQPEVPRGNDLIIEVGARAV